MKTTAKRLLTFFTLIMAVSWLWSCQELYHPELEADRQYLVVEGAITTDPGPHVIKLGYASIYGGPRHRRPVKEASLYLTNSQGESFHLRGPELHGQYGNYLTPYGFRGEVGETYVLHIETTDGTKYESDPQTIRDFVKPVQLEAVIGRDIQYFLSQVSDRVFQREIDGTHFYIETGTGNPDQTKFRFNTRLYLQYTYSEGIAFPVMYYCWENREITNMLKREVSHPETIRLRTAFIPRYGHQMHHFNFPKREYDSNRVITLEVFALNDEAYEFYLEKHNQLHDTGKIFDPIAAQIPGNIRAVNREGEQVFGFFEASSVHTEAYRVIINFVEGTVKMLPQDAGTDIPVSGCYREEHPPFWAGGM